jgi:hypothetical protein
MEKIEVIRDMGFYHPSNANWSFHIHLVIDKTGARLYKETFGGDDRMVRTMKAKGFNIESLYAGKGSGVEYKWKDCKDLLDIESYQGKNY